MHLFTIVDIDSRHDGRMPIGDRHDDALRVPLLCGRPRWLRRTVVALATLGAGVACTLAGSTLGFLIETAVAAVVG